MNLPAIYGAVAAGLLAAGAGRGAEIFVDAAQPRLRWAAAQLSAALAGTNQAATLQKPGDLQARGRTGPVV